MAIQPLRGGRTVLLVALVVTCAAALTAAGPSTAQFRTAVANPYALARQFSAGAPSGAATSARREPTNSSRPNKHSRSHRSLPSNMRGRDQLSIPGWPNELPF
jgi:hypothetical protein